MSQLSSIINTLTTEQLIKLRTEIDKKIENRLHLKKLNQSRHPEIIDNCFTTMVEEHGFNRTLVKFSKIGNLLTIDYELFDNENKELSFEFTAIHIHDLIRTNKRVYSEYGVGFYIMISSLSNLNKFMKLNSSHKRIPGTNFIDLKTITSEELDSYVGHNVLLSIRVKIDFSKTVNGI